MRTIVLDIWADLRRKRMLPVAAALLVALVATPVVLLRGTQEEPQPSDPAASAAQSPAPGSDGDVRLAEGFEASDLAAFDPRDPFEPRGRPRSRAADAGLPGQGVVVTPTTPGGATTASAPSTPSGGGSTSPSAPARRNPGTSDRSPSSRGDDGRGGQAEPEEPAEEPQPLTYTVDVKAGQPGSEALRSNVATLSLLPSETDPRFVYLGTTLTGKTAIFLVDAALQGTHSGDGECRPRPTECAFLYLRPENGRRRAVFTLQSDGDYFPETREVAIELVSINAETLRRVQERENTRRRRARAVNRRSRPAYRPFVAPLFR